MKHAVIVAHPDPGSFNLAVATTYAETARRLGHEVVVRDLYRLGFDPCLKASEIPRPGFAPADDVRGERAAIGDCTVFAFVYPLWFNAPPAMLKGYIDRVFTMGFGYGPITRGANEPLLSDRKMISFTSSGSPLEWLEEEGDWSAIRTLFDIHFCRVCGLQALGHVHFGGVNASVSQRAVKQNLVEVRKTVERLS